MHKVTLQMSVYIWQQNRSEIFVLALRRARTGNCRFWLFLITDSFCSRAIIRMTDKKFKYSQSAEANAAAHTAVEKAEKRSPRSASGGENAATGSRPGTERAESCTGFPGRKTKNYDYAFAKVKSTWRKYKCHGGNLQPHQTQAEAALAQARAEKIAAENEVNQKQTLLNQAQVESDAADENVKAKENALEKAENALKQLEAETNSSIVKKRADVDEKQNALDIAEKKN